MAGNPKKLYRSNSNKLIAGICGGLAEYFGVDPTVMRVIYVILTLITGILLGIVLYLILWAIIPQKS
ncbi:MAG: PspC domain-containing protein [Syntrophorhabdales bacterium]|jgi:phage shock protein C